MMVLATLLPWRINRSEPGSGWATGWPVRVKYSGVAVALPTAVEVMPVVANVITVL